MIKLLFQQGYSGCYVENRLQVIGAGGAGEQEWKQGDVLGSYCNIQVRGDDG